MMSTYAAVLDEPQTLRLYVVTSRFGSYLLA